MWPEVMAELAPGNIPKQFSRIKRVKIHGLQTSSQNLQIKVCMVASRYIEMGYFRRRKPKLNTFNVRG